MIRADVHLPFFRKFLWIGLALTAYGGWCLYDAWVTYPKKIKLAEEYSSVGSEGGLKSMATSGDFANAPEETVEELQSLISKQYFMLAVCAVGATFMFGKCLLARGAYLESDESMVRNSRGQTVPLDAIQRIDKRKWESKGIAVVHYDHGGISRRFILDDYKFDREATGRILKRIENHHASRSAPPTDSNARETVSSEGAPAPMEETSRMD